MLKKLTLLFFLVVISLNAEEVVNLNINSEDIEFKFLHEIKGNYVADETKYFLGASVLNSNDKNEKVANEDDDKLYTLEFMLKNSVPNMNSLEAGLGLKGIVHNLSDDDFLSLALGLELYLSLPLDPLPKISIGGEYYYAPKVLSFMEADTYNEYRMGAKIEIVKNGELYVGYRNIETNYKKRDFEYNSSAYAGIIFHIR